MLLERSPERDFDPSYALDYLVEHIGALGLEHRLEKTGDDVFPVYRASIYDNQKFTKWIGGGKGYKKQCLASALAECLQHHTAFNTILNYDSSQMPLLPPAQFLNAPVVEKLDKYSRIYKNNLQTEYFTLPYTDISNTENVINYPIALTEPRYDKSRYATMGGAESLLWRSHDTGSSLGITYNEALLHGIMEWVEKHSYSLFILAGFIENDPSHEVTHIDRDSLPRPTTELVEHIETQFDDNISIISLSNDFDVPCILTMFNKQTDCSVQPKGLACSLHRQYAVEKSIFEALQCRLLRNSNAEKRERQILNNFADYPVLLRAYQLAISDKMNRTIDYQDLPLCDDLNLAAQVHTISERLEKSGGYRIYRHIYGDEPGGLTSLHVLIPGFNESFLVKEGKFVVERTQRG